MGQCGEPGRGVDPQFDEPLLKKLIVAVGVRKERKFRAYQNAKKKWKEKNQTARKVVEIK